MAIKAVIMAEKGRAEIREVEKPKLRDGYVLVKVKAVALNPLDWKNLEVRFAPGVRMGADYAGVVEEVGPGVTKPFKKGDRIAGFVNCTNSLQPEDGSFCDYAVAKASVQIKIPDNITDEQAATLGVSVITIGQSLYKHMGLPLPTEPAKESQPILVHGASTASGLYGVQFLKASGLEVIATASPHNFEYLKSLGVSAVFDYHSPTAAADIKALTHNKLKLAWDCTGTGAELIAGALSDVEESKYYAIIPVDEAKVHSINPKVNGPHFTLGYDVVGEPYMWIDNKIAPGLPEDHDYIAKFVEIVPKLLADGTLKPIRTIVNQGGSGFEGLLKGLQELKAGKVSGGKLVYTL
ncbi:putative alcohol dehydrogenase [Hypoxylon sp. NC0597]|nr:putative alcohol dehydrogenase [Hypoxylon sp. NC0597]